MSDDRLLDRASVRRVRAALAAADVDADIIVLSDTARTAADAARALGVEQGAIVKSLVFVVGERPVLALVAGDRQCRQRALPRALGLAGKVRRADADIVRDATGFAIGGVAPVGHATALPTVIDASLTRYERVYAAAGHSHCVFGCAPGDLEKMTGAKTDAEIAE